MKKHLHALFVIIILFSFLSPLATEAASKKIGEFCSSDDECLSSDCEDNVCDCDDQGESSSSECAVGLQSGNAQDWRCIDEDKDPQERGNDFCVKSSYPGGSYPNESTGSVIYPISHKLSIGEKCENNDQCKTAYCEDSNLDGDYDNYCVCDSNSDCKETYGGEVSQWECKGDDTNGLNYCFNKSNNIPTTAIKTSVDNLSITDPLTNPTAVGEVFQSDIANIIQKPNPTITIPGLNFSEIDLSQMTETDSLGNSWLKIPFLGEYITAIYKYGIVIIGVIAVMNIILGGVTIMTGGSFTSKGSDGQSVTAGLNAGKKRIMMSVIAIIISTTSYTLLYIINPDLVNFRNLKILYIKTEGFEPPTGEEHYQENSQENYTNNESNNTADNTQSTSTITNKDKSLIVVEDDEAVDCSPFATTDCPASELPNRKNMNCATPRKLCREACLDNLPTNKRSTLISGKYSDDFLGQMDCNTIGERTLSKISHIVIHEGGSPNGAIGTWWGYQLSSNKDLHNIGSHYFITQDGQIHQILSETFSIIQSRKSTTGIGIDLQQGNCPNGQCPYSPGIYASLKELIADINGRVGRKLTVVGHCELNPSGEGHVDPRNFDWSQIGYDNDTHWRGNCAYPFGHNGLDKPTTEYIK